MAECGTGVHIEGNTSANIFGSFHYIVHEQAKSMVAIQELQQEVSSLLLFRQAVLAALPHLQGKSDINNSVATTVINNPPGTKINNAANTWTRRRHLQQQHQQQQYRSLHDSSEHTTATTSSGTTLHNGVADSGFSTEANSNTSPRSSRFETGSNPLDLGKLETGVLHLNLKANPMEREFIQHSERTKNRIARLKKDEDRLLALLNDNHDLSQAHHYEAQSPDELWQLLDEIQNKGLQLKEEMEHLKLVGTTKYYTPRRLPDINQSKNLREEKDYLERYLHRLERDIDYLKGKQLDAEQDLNGAQQRCTLAMKEVEFTRKRVMETEREIDMIKEKIHLLDGNPSSLIKTTTTDGDRSTNGMIPSSEEKTVEDNSESVAINSHGGGTRSSTNHVTRVNINEHNSNSSTIYNKKRVSFQDGVVTVSMPAPVVTSPASTMKYIRPNRDKVVAILRLSNPIQLQRHLLRALVENEALKEQMERTKTEMTSQDFQWRSTSQEIHEQMAALKEENEDLRFQLEEQKIELEGTKARLRIVNRTPPPIITSVQMKSMSTQTDQFLSPLYGINEWTQTDSFEKQHRILPRVVDASPKLKLGKQVIPDFSKTSNSWEEEDRPSVERRSYPSNTLPSRIPTPIKHGVINVAASKIVAKRELPNVPSLSSVGSQNSLRIKRKDKDNAASTPPPGKNLRVASKSRDINEAKLHVITLASAPNGTGKTRLQFADSLSSEENVNDSFYTVNEKVPYKADDYYDSINEHYSSNGRRSYMSPIDSLERSLPSVGINYHFRRTSDCCHSNRSYSSGSTTPSNSLSYHG